MTTGFPPTAVGQVEVPPKLRQVQRKRRARIG